LITGSQDWDPVIKRRGLGSSYKEERIGIQLSRGEDWDPVIKRGGLGSSYQEGRTGISLISLTLQKILMNVKVGTLIDINLGVLLIN
jgi:hypothetical protein